MATPREIIDQVPVRFDKALREGDVFYFPSTIHKHMEKDIEFEIRLCPALLKKPVLPVPHFDVAEPTIRVAGKTDPFLPPYIPNLFVGEINTDDGEYAILLNKYAVIPAHFLLVTKNFTSQNTPLTPTDLSTLYLHLRAAKKANSPYFAFYNCGDRSGASQPHKHIQLIPVPDGGPPIEVLARKQRLETIDKAFVIPSLPYAHFVHRLPELGDDQEEIEFTLGSIFMNLLDLVIATVRNDPDHPVGSPSFNVLLSLEHMHIIPRRQENHELKVTKDKMSINALGFAGMLLVKSDEELEAVKIENILDILAGVGVPKYDVGEQVTVAQDIEEHA